MDKVLACLTAGKGLNSDMTKKIFNSEKAIGPLILLGISATCNLSPNGPGNR